MTYFEGDPKNGLAPDDEARQLWLDQGVAEDHILTGNAKDNFWGTCVWFMRTGAASKIRPQKWAQLGHVDLAGTLPYFVSLSFIYLGIEQRNSL